MKKSDYRVTQKHERKTLRAVLQIEYEANDNFKGLPEFQVLEMTINPDYTGVNVLRVVSVNLIEPKPIKIVADDTHQ